VRNLFTATSGRIWVTLITLALLAGLAALYQASLKTDAVIVLLVPDEAALARPVTQAWLDAANEEGLSVVAMTNDAFLRYGGDSQQIAGVILPDTVHPQASELLINQLHSYVNAGGHLFITFDAALLDTQNGHYAAAQSRLSQLAGVRYAMYEALRDRTIALGPVYGSREHEKALGLLPGKLDFKMSTRLPLGELTTYGYDRLDYSHFRTEAPQGATTLLVSDVGDTIVSTHAFGRGTVLFANLPLGYLKTRTDAYLLHRLLGYFAFDLVRQPRLSPVPGAIGGLVLNLHVDSNAAQQPLLDMEAAGWFQQQGPFSIHVTAGPDTYADLDGLGLNLNNNTEMQAFLKRQRVLGHEVGNHGGWNHNVFGLEAAEDNRERFEPFLKLNQDSVAAATGVEPRSYSAPMGNQPRWATEWLRDNSFKAYYSTSDNGLGPTRSYEEGQRPAISAMWAFPISSYQRIATFEEVNSDRLGTTPEGIASHLVNLARHAADHHVARLFYFHPPAAVEHYPGLEALMTEAKIQGQRGRFRWYTMEQLSDFMNRRELAQWSMSRADGSRGGLTARSSASLNQLSWVFPETGIQSFRIAKGQATVRQEGKNWIVTAGEGRELEVQWD